MFYLPSCLPQRNVSQLFYSTRGETDVLWWGKGNRRGQQNKAWSKRTRTSRTAGGRGAQERFMDVYGSSQKKEVVCVCVSGRWERTVNGVLLLCGYIALSVPPRVYVPSVLGLLLLKTGSRKRGVRCDCWRPGGARREVVGRSRAQPWNEMCHASVSLVLRSKGVDDRCVLCMYDKHIT